MYKYKNTNAIEGNAWGGGQVTRNSSPAFSLINCTPLLAYYHDAVL